MDLIELYESAVLLSIRDKYAQRIIEGTKKAEIRRLFSSKMNISRVYVYVPSPQKKFIGYFQVTKINKMPIDKLWKKSGKESSLTRDEFFMYFSGKDVGFSIHFDTFISFSRPKSLDFVRNNYPDFYPPQSFIYVSKRMESLLLSV